MYDQIEQKLKDQELENMKKLQKNQNLEQEKKKLLSKA